MKYLKVSPTTYNDVWERAKAAGFFVTERKFTPNGTVLLVGQTDRPNFGLIRDDQIPKSFEAGGPPRG